MTLAADFAIPSAFAELPLSPIFGVGIPDGSSEWPVDAVSLEVPFNALRAISGNSIAMKAHRASRGFDRFLNSKAGDLAWYRTCFACHQAKVKGHDVVFTRLANEVRKDERSANAGANAIRLLCLS
jgi:hypothetical protein